jgi:hypothetical protein
MSDSTRIVIDRDSNEESAVTGHVDAAERYNLEVTSTTVQDIASSRPTTEMSPRTPTIMNSYQQAERWYHLYNKVIQQRVGASHLRLDLYTRHTCRFGVVYLEV